MDKNLQQKGGEMDIYHYNGLERFADLFSGIGGFRLGLESYTSPRCLYSVDSDKHCAEMYSLNFNNCECVNDNIRNVKYIPEVDLICAGFPCQSFSVSGKSSAKDERNDLWKEILRLVLACHKPPKALILENVPRFLTIRNGKDFGSFKSAFEQAGYELYFDILNASHYGVPQSRRRLYCVLLHKNSGLKYHTPENHLLSKAMPYLDSIVEPADALIADSICVDGTKVVWTYSKKLNYSCHPKPVRIGILNKGGQGQRVYSVYGHAVTQMANGGGQGAKTGLYHIYGRVRQLTFLEQKRVMGFPDTWHVSNGKEGRRQLGNAVIPKMTRIIYKAITSKGD
ncbi:cytosine-specific methyltransferase [Endomicrobiia bacterium]|nr:cytosine-specific methyltransferase [Endomicrobiia bacterium]